MPGEFQEIDEPVIESETVPENAEVPGNAIKHKFASAKSRRLLLAGGLFAVIALAVMVAYYWNRVSTDDAQVNGDIDPIASKVYGNVAEVLINDNQPIKAGEVIIRIDPRDYQAKVDQARATLALARARARAAAVTVPLTAETTRSVTAESQALVAARRAAYERARAALEQATGADLAFAVDNVAAKQAADDKAQADLRRVTPLAGKEEISRQELDAYSATARVTASELKAAKERLLAAQKQVEIRQAAMLNAQAELQRSRAALADSRASEKQVPISSARSASAQAAVQKAEADLEAAELQLSYCTITAPMDGVVTRKSVEPGQIVQPGQQLFVLVPLDRVWVTANFKETQLAHVHRGQRAEISVDMYGTTLRGHVDSIAGATGARTSLLPPENATGNFIKVVQRIPVKIPG